MEIRLKNLTKVFPGNPAKNIPDAVAVDSLNVDIRDGELIGLLGPSGCGKSTTLYMIAGLKAPTDGEIWFGDEDVTHLAPEKREIGLVFQNYALYPHMTVYDNVKFPLTNLHIVTNKVDKVLRNNDIVKKLLLNEFEHIVKIIVGSKFKGKYSKDMSARKLVKKYHIVTSLGERLFKYGFQNIETEESKQLNSLLAKKSELTGKLNVCKKEELKEKLSEELKAVKGQLEQIDQKAVAEGLNQVRLVRRDEVVASIDESNQKELERLNGKGLAVNEKFELLQNGEPISVKKRLDRDEMDALIQETARLVQID